MLIKWENHVILILDINILFISLFLLRKGITSDSLSSYHWLRDVISQIEKLEVRGHVLDINQLFKYSHNMQGPPKQV